MGVRWRSVACLCALIGCSSGSDPVPGLSSGLGGTTAADGDGDGSTGPDSGVATMWGATEMGTTSTGTGAPPPTSGGNSSSGGPDPDACSACMEVNCGQQLAACEGFPECACWLDCLGKGTSIDQCSSDCGDAPPEAQELAACMEVNCTDDCGNGGVVGTGTSTGAFTSGGGTGGIYEPCDDESACDGMLECNPLTGFCTEACDDDNECPDPPEGDAQPICGPTTGTCILACDMGTSCPDGMSCEMVLALLACVY